MSDGQSGVLFTEAGAKRIVDAVKKVEASSALDATGRAIKLHRQTYPLVYGNAGSVGSSGYSACTGQLNGYSGITPIFLFDDSFVLTDGTKPGEPRTTIVQIIPLAVGNFCSAGTRIGEAPKIHHIEFQYDDFSLQQPGDPSMQCEIDVTWKGFDVYSAYGGGCLPFNKTLSFDEPPGGVPQGSFSGYDVFWTLSQDQAARCAGTCPTPFNRAHVAGRVYIPWGMSGTSGYSGASGVSGASGISGYSGKSGISGTSGATGAQGVSGISGYSGAGFTGHSGTFLTAITGASGVCNGDGTITIYINGTSGWALTP